MRLNIYDISYLSPSFYTFNRQHTTLPALFLAMCRPKIILPLSDLMPTRRPRAVANASRQTRRTAANLKKWVILMRFRRLELRLFLVWLGARLAA